MVASTSLSARSVRVPTTVTVSRAFSGDALSGDCATADATSSPAAAATRRSARGRDANRKVTTKAEKAVESFILVVLVTLFKLSIRRIGSTH